MGGEKSCGSCTVCCTALAIETPGLRKQPGIACVHCTSTGCGIYETRFPICRTYFCGWFGLAELDESWRPDRSGLLISPHGAGIEFLVLGGEAAVRRPQFLALLARMLAGGTPVFVAVPGPAGHYPARVQINAPLSRVAPPSFGDAMAGLLKAAKGHRFEPMPP
ncbi:MAG: hypothetical protein ISS15_00140 [Alphaproteobacteria bacterium]|nr:hypothetical protein [Alphaproteobacteria bacterium]MBL7096039.1 hypothetical protein [Alphaproteobacteria bacterium]